MKTALAVRTVAAAGLLLVGTGCFRVSSDTQALRDAALANGLVEAEAQLEVGVGLVTVSLAKLAARYIELPSEARAVLNSLRNVECSIYRVQRPGESAARVLAQADKAMKRRGWERLTGVLDEEQMVAVYIPADVNSARDLAVSVLVLNQTQLVCASARGNAEELLQLAMAKVREFPAGTEWQERRALQSE